MSATTNNSCIMCRYMIEREPDFSFPKLETCSSFVWLGQVPGCEAREHAIYPQEQSNQPHVQSPRGGNGSYHGCAHLCFLAHLKSFKVARYFTSSIWLMMCTLIMMLPTLLLYPSCPYWSQYPLFINKIWNLISMRVTMHSWTLAYEIWVRFAGGNVYNMGYLFAILCKFKTWTDSCYKLNRRH